MKRRDGIKRTRMRKEVLDWRKEALQLRLDGLTIRQISAKLNRSPSTVHVAIAEELRAIPAEAAEDLRREMTEQYDSIIVPFIKKARKGDSEAANVAMNAMSKKAKLLGLDAEEASAITVSGSLHTAHDDVVGLLAAIAAKGAVGGSDPEPDSGAGSPPQV